ncbi:hypothetical protein [Paraburkholderia metrosideri]|uniref:Flagellar hook-length control protein FliK n=1 Tax=Paraburkholderia metrosideri TaxID=580937 RepID=A0ABM8NY84_9BURK|nr:hypothetical protein [Paraburkholderia metrosideri]CAD6549096.1 hypothetical protein LMG28140_04707 [Paraburkholderia metrosideri]
MKVDSSSVGRDMGVSSDGARIASGRTRPAFEQVLRAMEKDMWPGAKAGRMTGDPLPGQTQPNAKKGVASVVALNADASAGARNAFVASAGKLDAATTSLNAAPRSGSRLPPTSAAQHSGSGAQPDAEAVLTVFETPSPLTPSQSRTVSTESRVTHPPSASTSTPRFMHSPVSPALMSLNADGTAAPYRLTVMNGAGGVSVALRVSAARADELDTLTQRALDELDSHGARGVRLIVNGVEPVPTSLRGLPHAY